MPRNPVRVALVILDGFAALTAVGGGVALATGLEAERFPVDRLRGTPFASYTVPGLILTVVVGGSAAVAAVVTLRSPRAGGLASVLAGGVMMGWIVGEVLILRRPLSTETLWEVFYLAIGLLMALLGFRTWRTEGEHPPLPGSGRLASR